MALKYMPRRKSDALLVLAQNRTKNRKVTIRQSPGVNLSTDSISNIDIPVVPDNVADKFHYVLHGGVIHECAHLKRTKPMLKTECNGDGLWARMYNNFEDKRVEYFENEEHPSSLHEFNLLIKYAYERTKDGYDNGMINPFANAKIFADSLMQAISFSRRGFDINYMPEEIRKQFEPIIDIAMEEMSLFEKEMIDGPEGSLVALRYGKDLTDKIRKYMKDKKEEEQGEIEDETCEESTDGDSQKGDGNNSDKGEQNMEEDDEPCSSPEQSGDDDEEDGSDEDKKPSDSSKSTNDMDDKDDNEGEENDEEVDDDEGDEFDDEFPEDTDDDEEEGDEDDDEEDDEGDDDEEDDEGDREDEEGDGKVTPNSRNDKETDNSDDNNTGSDEADDDESPDMPEEGSSDEDTPTGDSSEMNPSSGLSGSEGKSLDDVDLDDIDDELDPDSNTNPRAGKGKARDANQEPSALVALEEDLNNLDDGNEAKDEFEKTYEAIKIEMKQIMSSKTQHLPHPAILEYDREEKPAYDATEAGRAAFGKIEEQVKREVKILKAKMLSVIMAKKRQHYQVDREEGDVDPEAIWGLKFGNSRVFQQLEDTKKLNTAIAWLVDCSGSMSNGAYGYGGGQPKKFEGARKAAIACGNVCQALRLPFAVYGFSTGHIPYSVTVNEEEKILHSLKENIELYNRFVPLHHRIFKDFNENYETVKYRMMQIYPSHANCDNESIMWAAEKLWQRPEKRKILFVLSDGMPSATGSDRSLLDQDLRFNIIKLERLGIEVHGIGIYTTEPQKFYKSFDAIESGKDDISRAVFKVLSQKLLNGF